MWSLVVKRDGQADERLDGARLTVGAVTEPDADRDLRGDETEDRTDLRVSTAARRVGGRVRAEVTVTNAGPLVADRPRLTAELPTGIWQAECPRYPLFPMCQLPPLPPGASTTIVLDTPDPIAEGGRIHVESEGPDLVPADNATGISFVSDPPVLAASFALTTAKQQRLRRGIKVVVRGEGRTRVTVAFEVRGRTVRLARTVTLKAGVARTVTLRAHGAKLRTLRRAVERRPLLAAVTVRGPGGAIAATSTTTVRP